MLRQQLFFFLCCLCALQSRAQDSAVIFLADPAILHHKGTYYLYGTVEGKTDEGFQVYTSTDRRQWNLAGYALKKGAAFGTKGFWAPQVFQLRDTFYMAYTANEGIAIATSLHPQGPFTQQEQQPLAAPVKQIDPFVFTDSDGKKYLYHVRLTNGNKIYVAEMTGDLRGIKPETLQECVSATDKWENTANTGWPVTEGPSVFKHKGLYYLVYTANDFRSPDYAVGYATSKSPLGPWQKHSGNPILSKGMLGQNGTGHGDFFKDAGGQLSYVFHTHFSSQRVGPRKTAVVRAVLHKNVLLLAPATFHYLTR